MSLPLHRKFGYEHMLEMQRIEAALRANGVTGIELHFAAVRTYEALHRGDPSYRERQKAWLATSTAETKPDLFRVALEEIRDGHNDPRALARQVLAQ